MYMEDVCGYIYILFVIFFIIFLYFFITFSDLFDYNNLG